MTRWSPLRLHDGGPCPVGEDDVVRVVIGLPGLTAQLVDAGIKAIKFDWSSFPAEKISTGKFNALPIIAYQVAPPEPRDMQVPWHVLPKEYPFAVRNPDGKAYAIKRNNGRSETAWFMDWCPIRIDQLIGYDPGDKPWDQRPEGV